MTTDREKFFEPVTEDEMYEASPYGQLHAAQNELAVLKAEHARLREAAERAYELLNVDGAAFETRKVHRILRAALDSGRGEP